MSFVFIILIYSKYFIFSCTLKSSTIQIYPILSQIWQMLCKAIAIFSVFLIANYITCNRFYTLWLWLRQVSSKKHIHKKLWIIEEHETIIHKSSASKTPSSSFLLKQICFNKETTIQKCWNHGFPNTKFWLKD